LSLASLNLQSGRGSLGHDHPLNGHVGREMFEQAGLREIEVVHELHRGERAQTVVVGFLVVRVGQRQRPLGDLSQRLETYVLVRDVGDDDLARVDLVDQELLDLPLGLVFLEITLDDQQVLVDVGVGLLDLFQKDDHVGCSFDLDAPTFT